VTPDLRIAWGSLVVAAALLLGGCGGSSDGETSPPPLAAEETTTSADESAEEGLDGCATSEDGTIVAIPAGEGETLDGIVVGEGPVGVVLAHQRASNLCAWLPFARRLAERGHAALAFDFTHLDLADSVTAAADELRRRGARRIVLVGASMGGTAALVAARSVPGVAGVVSVSGPELFGNLDAGAAVRGLDAPVLLIVARGDAAFVADARQLFQRASSAEKRLVVLSGSGHGTDFFGEPVGGRAPRLVEAFVAKSGR
jgi:pimeloyl-ACP methyl ester carboxylesterase